MGSMLARWKDWRRDNDLNTNLVGRLGVIRGNDFNVS